MPEFLRRGRGDDDDDEMFRCRNPAQMPSSNYSSTIRASSTMLPPPGTATTYVNSPRPLSHQDSSLSMRKPEPAALLSTIPDDEHDDFAEVDPRFPRRSQIGMALSKLPTPPRVDDGHGASWQRDSNGSSNGPYSPRTPIYSSIRSEDLPSPRAHFRHEGATTPTTTTTTTTNSRHHSFSRPTSRPVDLGAAAPPRTPRLPTHSTELSRGRSRSRSRSRARAGTGGGALSRDASHDSTSSRVPISRFNSVAGASRASVGGGAGPGPASVDLIDDGASSAGVSMTTIWSDAPRRGSKHSRI